MIRSIALLSTALFFASTCSAGIVIRNEVLVTDGLAGTANVEINIYGRSTGGDQDLRGWAFSSAITVDSNPFDLAAAIVFVPSDPDNDFSRQFARANPVDENTITFSGLFPSSGNAAIGENGSIRDVSAPGFLIASISFDVEKTISEQTLRVTNTEALVPSTMTQGFFFVNTDNNPIKLQGTELTLNEIGAGLNSGEIAAFSAVPEPNAAILAISGLALCVRRRRI